MENSHNAEQPPMTLSYSLWHLPYRHDLIPENSSFHRKAITLTRSNSHSHHHSSWRSMSIAHPGIQLDRQTETGSDCTFSYSHLIPIRSLCGHFKINSTQFRNLRNPIARTFRNRTRNRLILLSTSTAPTIHCRSGPIPPRGANPTATLHPFSLQAGSLIFFWFPISQFVFVRVTAHPLWPIDSINWMDGWLAWPLTASSPSVVIHRRRMIFKNFAAVRTIANKI